MDTKIILTLLQNMAACFSRLTVSTTLICRVISLLTERRRNILFFQNDTFIERTLLAIKMYSFVSVIHY